MTETKQTINKVTNNQQKEVHCPKSEKIVDAKGNGDHVCNWEYHEYGCMGFK